MRLSQETVNSRFPGHLLILPTAIQDELAFQLEKNVAAEGEAASRIQASTDFFITSAGGEAKRVVGSPPETATTLDTATAAGKPTVAWYVGDNGTGSSRDTATVQADNGFSVFLRARANEDSISHQLAMVMAFTLPTYDQDSDLDKTGMVLLLTPFRPSFQVSIKGMWSKLLPQNLEWPESDG